MDRTENDVLVPHPGDSKNLKQVKALYVALKAKNQTRLRELLVSEPTWDVSPGFPGGAIYRGMTEIFGEFYGHLLASVHTFGAFPDRFVDGGNTVVALGHYRFTAREGDVPTHVRFAHTWSLDGEGRIEGVWQVADSAQFQNTQR